MATIGGLRRQIEALQQELDRVHRDRQSLNERVSQESRRQMEALEQNFQKMRREDQERLRESYASLREELLQNQKAELETIRRQEEQARQKREKLLAEIEQLRDELKKEIEKQIAEHEQQKDRGRAMAEQLQSQADGSLEQVRQVPHAFFFPGQLELIESRLPQIVHALENGMYQAAASMALSAVTELDLLKNRTNQKLQEWKEIFDDYATLVLFLEQRMQLFEREPIETEAGSFVLQERERSFWSMGEYPELAKKIRQYAAAVHEMQGEDLNRFLNTAEMHKGYELMKDLKQIEKLDGELTGAMEYIERERFFSDQRFCRGERICRRMEQDGYFCEKASFLPASEEKRKKSWFILFAEDGEDPTDSYELLFPLNQRERDYLRVRLVPKREHGLVVGNQCLLMLHVESFAEPALMRDLIHVFAERIQQTVQIETQEIQEKDASTLQTEERLKQKPDVLEYQKYRRKTVKKEVR